MQKKFFLCVFFLAVFIDLVAISVDNRSIQFIVKPLILVSLILYFIFQSGKGERNLRNYLGGGLLFSLFGDIFLMFDTDPPFFLYGLSAFLLAHIFYIIFFYSILRKEKVHAALFLFILVAIYYSALIFILYPVLGEMKLPVLIYGFIISTMFVLALHMTRMKYSLAGKWMAAGASFFVLSDSMLAFNKFYQAFPLAGIFIMLSYAAAQFCILTGGLYYLNKKVKIQI